MVGKILRILKIMHPYTFFIETLLLEIHVRVRYRDAICLLLYIHTRLLSFVYYLFAPIIPTYFLNLFICTCIHRCFLYLFCILELDPAFHIVLLQYILLYN